MEEKREPPKFYGSFTVSPEGVDITEPEDFPAMYGGVIIYNEKEEIILDFGYVKDREDYEEFVRWLNEIYEKKVDKLSKAVSKIDELSHSLFIEEGLVDIAKEYTTIVDNEDVEILKAGWSLAVKRYGKRPTVAGVAGYESWRQYAGIDVWTSEEINARLWDLVFDKRIYNLDELVKDLIKEFGLSEDKAEVIVRTEMANIFNKAREWAYLRKTDAKKFVWVTKGDVDVCELCKEVERRAADGVSLEELKKIIAEVGGEYSREWTVHPSCRCTFVKKHGRKKGWERV